MIRTEIPCAEIPCTEDTDADGTPHWLIVTQVEHARISGELAQFYAPSLMQDSAMRVEVLRAVTHHDDGWDEWDRCPRLDEASRKPLSFRELPVGESLQIWSGSIDSAARIGPLAGWLVASHFRGLLQTSSKSCDLQEVEDWVRRIDTDRQQWLMQWQRLDPAGHTLELAQRALLFLQVVDVMSLWLCSACFRQDGNASELYSMAEGTELGTGIKRVSTARGSVPQVQVLPWRFEQPEIELRGEAFLAPAKKYDKCDDLVDAYKQFPLTWQLAGT